jgi:hypothetical protein
MLSQRVRRVALESYSLSAQMRLIQSCAALIAVHGQAMAWVFFLPSQSQRTSAVEIFPAGFGAHAPLLPHCLASHFACHLCAVRVPVGSCGC